jgi:SAM-dependent methyltransferase
MLIARVVFIVALLVAASSCSSGGHTGPVSSALHESNTTRPTTLEVTEPMFSEGDAYERFMGRWSRLLAPGLIELAGVRDGDAVLDVGSGTGALAFAILDATSTTRVTGIDPSAAYVSHAKAKSQDPRTRFEIGDGQALVFSDAQFDKTLSLLVMNFIPDRERALKEMVRVTKSGGVVSAAVWDYSEGMEMLRVFWDEAIALDPASAPRDEAHMPLCKRGELAAFWQRAGLKDVAEEPLTVTLHFATFEDYWEPFLLGQGPAGAYTTHLPKQRQTELARRLRQRLLGGGPDRAIEMRARAWAVKGVVP